MHDHSRYYSSHGVWYRPYRGRYAVVAPPIGLFIPFLPLAYTTIWMSGIPYYYANETYYTETSKSVIGTKDTRALNISYILKDPTSKIEDYFLYTDEIEELSKYVLAK